MSVKTRFAPSPTGLLHLGNLRTALFSYLYANSAGGIFLLRIEDTDPERSKQAYIDALVEDLQWLNVNWQEGIGENQDLGRGPYQQSLRADTYDHYYQLLIDKGLAYPCFCSEKKLAMTRKAQRLAGQPPRYPGTCRHLSDSEQQAKRDEGIKPTLRFFVEDTREIKFTDLIKGQQTFLGKEIGDFIIRRQDGSGSFMFCNAIDDALMGVTHVLRGDDHLTNSPRQLMILEALDLPTLNYGHLSLIVGSDNAPLSKRNGSQSVRDLRDAGYLPLAVNNYLARLGHYYADNDFMSLEALSEKFDLSKLGKAPAKFDKAQLDYWQKQAILQADDETLWQWSGVAQSDVPEAQHEVFIAVLRANAETPAAAQLWHQVFFNDALDLSSAQGVLTETGADFFVSCLTALEEEQVHFKAFAALVTEQTGAKGKKLFQPLRLALTAENHGPDMQSIFDLLGPEKIKQRFTQVISFLNQ